MPSLGLAIIARDEEAAVPLAIASARPYVDEVVVAVDSRTTDRTRQVAEDAVNRIGHGNLTGVLTGGQRRLQSQPVEFVADD